MHYVEPHTPYELQEGFLEQIGPAPDGDPRAKSYRYDSEIAYVDDQIGRFLTGVEKLSGLENTLVAFVSDHGESLGEHDYWGHGRNLKEPNLSIPMGIVFPGRVHPGVESAPAMITDLAPTIVGLLGLEVPDFFHGFDWSPVFAGEAPSPVDRVVFFETHKGAVKPGESGRSVRRKGLLEVGALSGGHKESFRVKEEVRALFDLTRDRTELENLAEPDSAISESLQQWLNDVRVGLARSDELPPPSLTDDDMEALRALGYLD